MTRPSRALRWALVLAVTLAVVGCGAGTPDHVRLGVIAPLTGPRAYLGQEVVQGAEMAVEDLNARGGLLGEPVELVVVDDADLVSLPSQLADLAERHRVTAVIGPEAPGLLTGPRSPLTRRGVAALVPTGFTGAFGDAATFVGRTVPSARTQAETLGRWFAGRGIDRAAVLLVDPVEGSAAEAPLREGLTGAGVDVLAVAVADADAPRLQPAVAALRDRAPDAQAVLLWGPPPTAARATLAVRALDWDVQVAVPASAFVAEYRTLTQTASEGVVLAFPFREEWFGAELTDWMVRYHRDHGIGALPGLETLVLDLPVVAVAAYDAVRVVADAVRTADTRSPEPVADALTEVRTDGILRTYAFGPDGEAYQPDDLFVARFHRLAIVFDADPRRDPERQRRFWAAQVSAEFLPPEVLQGPAGDLIRSLLAARQGEVPEYVPPAPGPQPVARPPTDP